MFFLFVLLHVSLFVNSLLILFSFLFVFPSFFMYFNLSFSFISLNMFFSLDYFSFILIILTFWIIFLSVFSSVDLKSSKHFWMYLFMFILLTFFLLVFFLSTNIFFFFFFFESSLFPTLYLIVGWGSNVERIQSGMYLFFYTLFGSMPMMISIFYLVNSNESSYFGFLDLSEFYTLMNLFLVFSFLIKMPMFFVHSWLPKAHVEAPVSGSMVLAGVLLKMGGYGLYRMFFVLKHNLTFNYIWVYISIWGGVFSSFICLRQSDLKSLVAYSSVSHMSMVIMGLFIMSDISILGSLMLMVAHGLCSSCLFYLVNLVYERSGTRSIFLNKGLLSIYPSMSMWWFLMCSFNMAAPPSLNLISEIFLMISISSWSFIFIFILMVLSFFGGVYNLFLYTFCNHGMVHNSVSFLNPSLVKEFLLIYMHFFPILFFFLNLEFFY